MSEDINYVIYVENNITKLWERDLNDWEFCHKGLEEWSQKFQNFLLK
jgi:hypothetical protein